MKYLPTIILVTATLFFGIYAMVLELKGISPLDQLFWCMLFGLLTYWSKSFPLPEKIIRFIKQYPKTNKQIAQEIFDYFKVEHIDSQIFALGDFANKDFCNWLRFIHDVIQKTLDEKLINGNKVENYINITLYIGGQKVDIAIIKDGKKGPHEILMESKHIKGDYDEKNR